MEVVVNSCCGGFAISKKAYDALVEMNSELIEHFSKPSKYNWSHIQDYHEESKLRSHPDLVLVVKKLGKEANGEHAELRIIEIPDDVIYKIVDDHGMESIHEVHRSWY